MDALRRLKTMLEEDFHVLYHTSAFAYIKKRCTVDAVKRHQKNESKWFGKERGMRLANISYNGRRVYIGRYKHKEDAVKARLEKEIELFGEYAPQRALYQIY